MALAARHTFQVLTKRPERAREHAARLSRSIQPLEAAARDMGYTFQWEGHPLLPWPIPNVWIGTSIEDRRNGERRAFELAGVPAAVRFWSVEPLLEDLGDLTGLCLDRKSTRLNSSH